MAPVIVAKDLYKCYPGFPPVLRGVNISVEPGEMVAIMGPSGCGKSTMLHVLGMLHAPDAGTLTVMDTNVLTLTSEETAAFRRGNMGFVMQSSNLFDHSTVFENVEFPLIYEQVPPAERWERVIRALELVRLSHRVNYRSNRLSGGEQQRVAIARAMVNNPRILLADEPTGALDARTSRVVMENFRTLAHEGGVAMVVVTHDPHVAEYCDSVYTLEDGLLVCHRNDPVPPPSGDGLNLLGTAPRLCDAACVVGHFPEPCGTVQVQDVYNLYEKNALARVYSLYGSGLSGLMGGDSQGLPVPMRRQGMWSLPWVILSSVRRMREHSAMFWRMWSSVPLGWRMRSFPWRLRTLAVGVRMASWCVDDNISHVHGLDAREGAFAAWVASRLLGLPFSFSVRGSDVVRVPALQLASMAQDAAFVRCDTEHTLKKVQEICSDKVKCRLIRDPLTLPVPDTDAVVPQAPTGKVRMLAVGVLKKRKGLGVLLKACTLLHKQNIPFTLDIVGEGSWLARQVLRVRILCAGLRTRVRLAGYVPHENIGVELQKTDIFVSGGLQGYGYDNQWPAALGEAMLYGVPVVVSDLPAVTELVRHKVNGYVVPSGDAAALADALRHCMHFPDEAKACGEQGQKDCMQAQELESKAHLLADALMDCQAARTKARKA